MVDFLGYSAIRYRVDQKFLQICKRVIPGRRAFAEHGCIVSFMAILWIFLY